jgi:hypothetical protein
MSTISFNCSGRDFSDEEWSQILRELDACLAESGLPILYGERWEDGEDGCVFEGTDDEIERVRQVLSKFPLTINYYHQ